MKSHYSQPKFEKDGLKLKNVIFCQNKAANLESIESVFTINFVEIGIFVSILLTCSVRGLSMQIQYSFLLMNFSFLSKKLKNKSLENQKDSHSLDSTPHLIQGSVPAFSLSGPIFVLLLEISCNNPFLWEYLIGGSHSLKIVPNINFQPVFVDYYSHTAE